MNCLAKSAGVPQAVPTVANAALKKSKNLSHGCFTFVATKEAHSATSPVYIRVLSKTRAEDRQGRERRVKVATKRGFNSTMCCRPMGRQHTD